jgi:hypothetical protein
MLIFLVLFKDVFPESDFASDSFADVPVRVLRPQSAHAKEVQGWLIDGVYDALKRKYVSKVQLSIGAAHDSSAQFFEEYSFCISYNDGAPVVALDFPSNGGSVSLASAEELQYNRVTRMLRSMVTFLTPMPDLIDDDKRVSMRLLYTPDCPPDYEPCYFRAMRADSDARLFPQPTAALSEYEMLELGSLDTPYHTLSLTLTSRELDDDDTSIEPARLMQFALNGGAVDLDCDDSDDQSPDGDVVYDTATPLSEPYGGGGGGGYDDEHSGSPPVGRASCGTRRPRRRLRRHQQQRQRRRPAEGCWRRSVAARASTIRAAPAAGVCDDCGRLGCGAAQPHGSTQRAPAVV